MRIDEAAAVSSEPLEPPVAAAEEAELAAAEGDVVGADSVARSPTEAVADADVDA